MNTANEYSNWASSARNNPPSFPGEELNSDNVAIDWGSPDPSNPHEYGDQATPTRSSGRIINFPPQTDNDCKDYDFSDNVDPNHSDESPTHTPVQNTSANLVSPKPGASTPRQDWTSVPTQPRPQHRSTTLTPRDAPSEPTVSTRPEMPMAPRALSASFDGPEALAQAVLDQTEAMNNTISDKNIDPNLPPSPPTTTSPQGSNPTIETSFEDKESAQLAFLDHVRVQAKQTVNSELDPSANRSQPSTRGPSRSPVRESSKDNTEVEGGNQPARSRRPNTARPPQDGRNSSHAGSVNSATSSKPKNRLLNTELRSKLLKLIDTLIEGYDNKHHIGSLRMDVYDKIIEFYDEHAYGPAERLDENTLLVIACSYEEATKSIRSTLIVNSVEKAYVEAGWYLKSRRLEETRADSPILNPHTLPPSLPRPNGRNSQHRTPSGKRRPNSQSGTSPSGKRSRQNSTQQSINSAPPESYTSVSQRQTAKEFQCDICPAEFKEQRKLIQHHDIHKPCFFWACIFDNCSFVANVSWGVTQHCATHPKYSPLDPVFKDDVETNKFVILEGGHECCIYCLTNFPNKNSRSHIANHIRTMTPEARLAKYNHRCTDKMCGKSGHWKSSQYVRDLAKRIRASTEEGTEATGSSAGREGGDGEDGQDSGGSASEGDGASGGLGGGNGGGNGGGSGGGSGGYGGGSGGGYGGGYGGGDGGGDGGGSGGEHMTATTRHLRTAYRAFKGSIPSSNYRSLTSHNLDGFPSADSTYGINRYLSTTDYAVGGRFAPSKSDVPVVVGKMELYLDEISNPVLPVIR